MGRASRREKGDAVRRSELLDVAARVFAKRGFTGAQIAEVASEAEMSLATIYSLYPSKADLCDAVVESVCRDFEERLTAANLEEIESPAERFLAFIDVIVEYDSEESDPAKISQLGAMLMPWNVRATFGERTIEASREVNQRIIALTADFEKQLGMSGKGALAVSVLGAVLHTVSAVESQILSMELSELAEDLKRHYRHLAATPPGKKTRRSGTSSRNRRAPRRG